MNISVITVSDSAYAGNRTDLSGPAVKAHLEEAGFAVAAMRTVPDDRSEIAHCLRNLAGTPGAIFTTGGTGITPRDITPEATRDVIEREIPGLGETMRMKGLQFTPRAVLSRGGCGLYRRSPYCQSTGIAERCGAVFRCYFGFGPARAGPD